MSEVSPPDSSAAGVPDARAHAFRGAIRLGSGQAVLVILQAATIIVMARLLSPADYGLIAMVTAVIGVAEILRDFGLTFATVQAREMSRDLQDNLFWVNFAAGFALSVVTYFASGPIADLYGEPRLVPITHVLCWVFAINGLSAQALADLNRRLRFGALALGDVLAGFFALTVAIVAAELGAGYWALVIQQLVMSSVATGFYLAAAGWLPHWYHRGVSTLAILRYGLSLVANQAVGYIGVNADSVIIGTRLGAVQLGTYDRSFQLLTVPLTRLSGPATKVALPLLSRAQDDPARFRRLLVQGQLAVVHPVMFLFSLAVASGQVAVPLILGRQWSAVVEPFQILCLAGCMIAAAFVSQWAFMATASMREFLRLSVAVTPLTVGLMYAGSNWGVDGVAAGYSLGTVVYWPASLWLLRRHKGVPSWELFGGGLRALLCYAAPAVVAATVIRGGDADLRACLLGSAGYVLAWLLVTAASRRLRADLRELYAMARGMLWAREPATEIS